MTGRRLLQRKLAATAPSESAPLAPDLLAAVRRRLDTLIVLMAAGAGVYTLIGLLAMPATQPGFDARHVGVRGASLLFLLLGGALVLRLSKRARTSADLQKLGAAFVLLAAAAAGSSRFMSVARVGIGSGWSGLTLLIAMFPVLVPVPPRRALLVGLAATTIEAALYVATSLAFAPAAPRLAETLLMLRGDLAASAVAAGVAWVVDDLRSKLNAARKLGSYELLEQIGHGGMGEVWRARHGALARPAAVKLIKPEGVVGRSAQRRAVLLARFAREARATALLECPHTIDVYDFGEADDGTLYYAMELLTGLDLQEVVERHGPLPANRVIHLLTQICESLHEAHARGLIHRDIKPSNLFLCRYGGQHDFIKVLDFGLVKSLELEAGAQLTADGLMGTPAYIAPEQAQRGSQTDARSDIYALGCVGYWLLTGELVFTGESMAELVLAHVERDPIPPSVRAPGRGIPAGVERVIMQMLAKRPEDRPQSAIELAEELARVDVGRRWTEADARGWWDAEVGDRLGGGGIEDDGGSWAEAATEVG